MSQQQGFTVLDGLEIDRTLVADLGPIADVARDIATELGARPYRVSLVWTRWSGGERGIGSEDIEREELLLPTPRVADLTAVARQVTAVGMAEQGDVRVTEISSRYTEDFLLGTDDDGTALGPDQSFYWEVEYRRPDGAGPRRRFLPVAAPAFQAENCQWVVTLVKVSEDRSRAGSPRT